MGIPIPRRGKQIGGWAAELIQACNADLEERLQRGAMYRNLYLTGDENGNPATYPKSYAYIDNLASMLFSPLELRYQIKFHGGGNATDRAMGRAASADLHEMMSDAGVYSSISDAVEWSLVKGLALVKLNWEGNGFASYMIQPEFLGVLRPDLNDLDRQDAFTHSTYYTPAHFHAAFSHLPNIDQIMKNVIRRGNRGRPDERPDRANALKQIVLGGLNPFTQAGQSPAVSSSRGIVNWLGGPQPTFDPKVMAELVRLDELWVRDSMTGDWATFQTIGDVVVTGLDPGGNPLIRNAFADMFDTDNPRKRLPEAFRNDNPLSGMQPFTAVCPNHLDGYFYGRSELCNVGALQMQINARLNGIGRLLRREENPPRMMTGVVGLSDAKYSAMDKPGGKYIDPSPNGKIQNLYQEIPKDLWESLHEYEVMYDGMAGLPPVLQGRGESGVRAQGHAETLTRNASPRFKDRALIIERAVSDIGQLALSMLRVMDNRTVVAWLKPDTHNIVAKMEPDDPELEAPAEGMRQYPFKFYHIPHHTKVGVDSHSSSPVFVHEARQLIFDLVKIGAMTPEEAVEHLHPAGEDDIIAEMERREIQKQKTIESLPPQDRIKLISGVGSKRHN